MRWQRANPPTRWYPKRGEICLFDLDKERPAIVISSDAINRHSLDVCVIPVSKVEHRSFSLRPKLQRGEGGLELESWAKCDQPTTIEKRLAVFPPLGSVSPETMAVIEKAVRECLELEP